MTLLRNQILHGDALQHLSRMPAASIDCVITSPPYFRLRDYGEPGQLGLESHIDAWAERLRMLAEEVRRVLVPTGSFWLNLGDSYSTHQREGTARKSLLLGPERILLALSRDGWIVRNKIIWAKTNTIPSSVRDRLSTTHEVIYLLTKSSHYFLDLDDIRVPHTSRPPKRRTTPMNSRAVRPDWLGPNADGDRGLAALHAAGLAGHPLGKNPGDVWPMAASGFRGAHFATYPEHLVERMVRAGCPERRCERCKAPWRRPVRRLGAMAVREALNPTCACPNAHSRGERGLVLDPFIGSGTTAVVAERLGRDWLGVELNPDYIVLAEERLRTSRDRGENRASKGAA